MDNAMQVVGENTGGQTAVHPVGLLAVAVLGLCLILLPRRWAAIPLLVVACFIPSSQRIIIAGCDFNFLRILVIFGFMRLLVRKEYLQLTWKSLDTALALWAMSSTFFYTLQVGTFSAFVNRMGFSFDAVGMYFLFRCLIQNWKDIDRLIIGCVWLSIPVAFFFLLENRTGRNVFSIFGGVAEITSVRDGKLRCTGAFGNPIIAGCFWASLTPLIAALWWKSAKGKLLAIAGIFSSLVVVFCCASSTPMMGILAAVIGGVFFYGRYYMRYVRWSIVFILIFLHMIMNKPVWHLIARVNIFSGSTGYHRYKLINEAIKNFDQWWFSGCSGHTVASWGIWAADITNQFILEGIRGGFLTLCLFIAVVTIGFRDVGRLWRMQKSGSFQMAVSWALGVTLFVHCINFIGVSYFGNIGILWYMSLGLIGSMAVQSDLPATTMPRKFKAK